MELYNGDCLEVMKDLSDNSVDIVIADLPYGRFLHLGKEQKDGKGWDIPIDLKKMWEQLWRICKPTCPIFLFADFKFAVEIFNSQPKYFKYEIVWHKGQTTTPLLSRKRFGKCTEYILVFHKKQPVYNYAKYHKIIKTVKSREKQKVSIMKFDSKNKFSNKYEPKLPLNIIEEKVFSSMVMGKNEKLYHSKSGKYKPRLPLNIIEENEIVPKDFNNNGVVKWVQAKRDANDYEPKLPLNVIKCKSKIRNKIIKKLTEKPQFILEHLLKYYSNEGDTCLDMTMGSGSCGVACHSLARKFIGIEKNEEFYEITKERLLSLSSSSVDK